jgi:hypothetical protein
MRYAQELAQRLASIHQFKHAAGLLAVDKRTSVPMPELSMCVSSLQPSTMRFAPGAMA